ncbi:MAG: hypothetical protein AB1726_18745 [Planctomycetota bacterium]
MKKHSESGGTSILEAPTEGTGRAAPAARPATRPPADEELIALLERAFRYVGPPILRPAERKVLQRIRLRLGRRMAFRLLTGRDPGRRPPFPY